MYNYRKHSKQMLSALKGLKEKTKSTVVQRLVENKERSKSLGIPLADKVFHESMDMYLQGDMTWEETVDDLSKTLKAIDMEKTIDDGDEEMDY